MRQGLKILTHFVALGILYGGISAFVLIPDPIWSLVVGIPTGAIAGAMCAPIGMACLWRKDINEATRVLAIGVAPSVAMLTLLLGNIIAVLLTSVCCFILAVIFVGARLPDRPELIDPTKCKTCGYNLTGNVSGICPECGTAICDASRTSTPGDNP